MLFCKCIMKCSNKRFCAHHIFKALCTGLEEMIVAVSEQLEVERKGLEKWQEYKV